MRKAFECFAIGVFVFLAAGSFATAEQADEPPAKDGAAVYASFLWVGESENDCMLRDTLLTGSPKRCESEFKRVEGEVKRLVERRNKRGANFSWGVFVKCGVYADTKEFKAELERYRKRCMGQ